MYGFVFYVLLVDSHGETDIIKSIIDMCFQISVICSLLVKVNNSFYVQLLLTCVHQLLANVIPTHHGQWTDSV